MEDGSGLAEAADRKPGQERDERPAVRARQLGGGGGVGGLDRQTVQGEGVPRA